MGNLKREPEVPVRQAFRDAGSAMGDLTIRKASSTVDKSPLSKPPAETSTVSAIGQSRGIPSLDGVRALAISLVIFAHLCGTKNFLGVEAVHFIGDLGNFGVRIFFVLSGYLITTILLEEENCTGRISLKRFYLRRTFRIFPACYVLLLTLVCLRYVNILVISRSDLLHAVTYTMNLHPQHVWQVGHLWSLSVEEQFYLLWPATLAYLGVRRGVKVAVGVTLICPVLRVLALIALPSYRAAHGGAVLPGLLVDPLAVGCLLAAGAGFLSAQRAFMRNLHSSAFYAIPLCAVLLNAGLQTRMREIGVVETILNGLIALSIFRWVSLPQDWMGTVLNSPLLKSVGVLSYSLYLWQQLFINRTGGAWWNAFPWNVLCAFGCASASYYCVERPFLRARSKIERAAWERGDFKQ
jgi:peptidoglycan/LPS O-acetylase OafA/YrhL